MSSSSSPASTSQLLSQSNELLANLARLNSNVQLYKQVRLLQENTNGLEKKYESLKKDIKTSTCNSQCKKLNENINNYQENKFFDHFYKSCLWRE